MKNQINGFAINCGDDNGIIKLKNGLFYIDLFKGDYNQAKTYIINKYKNKNIFSKFINFIFNKNKLQNHLLKLDDCINMNWLTDEIHSELKNSKSWYIRKTIAQYSNIFHHYFKDDIDEDVRKVVAKFSDKYHHQFKDDDHYDVRKVVAKFSNKYHAQFKDDSSSYIRNIVKQYKGC